MAKKPSAIDLAFSTMFLLFSIVIAEILGADVPGAAFLLLILAFAAGAFAGRYWTCFQLLQLVEECA